MTLIIGGIHMDKNKILEVLNKSSELQSIEEIQYKPDFFVVRFFYGYDESEMDAAKDYANSQDNNDDEDKWYDEFYLPYLVDIAVDEVRDIIEELVDNHNLSAEYISYEPDRDDDNCEFIAVFTNEDKEFDIDSILDELKI
jgi:hypothetical protein